MHDAASSPVEVNLDGVARDVAIESRLVSLVRGTVVEAGLREGKNGNRGAGGRDELREDHNDEGVHRDRLTRSLNSVKRCRVTSIAHLAPTYGINGRTRSGIEPCACNVAE